jgi:hypothetical protein
LKQHVSSVTLAQSIYKIARVAYYLSPGRDWRWLQRLVRRLQLRAKPRDKRNDVVPIKELSRLGRQLMDQAENAAKATNYFRALLFRDGLIIALLAADPLRLANHDLECQYPIRGNKGWSTASRHFAKLECALYRSVCSALPIILAKCRINKPTLARPSWSTPHRQCTLSPGL